MPKPMAAQGIHGPSGVTPLSASPTVSHPLQPFGRRVVLGSQIAKAVRLQLIDSFHGVKLLVYANIAVRAEFVKYSIRYAGSSFSRRAYAVISRVDHCKSRVQPWVTKVFILCTKYYNASDWKDLPKQYSIRIAQSMLVLNLVLVLKYRKQIRNTLARACEVAGEAFPPVWKVVRRKTDPYTYPIRERFGPVVDKLIEIAPGCFDGCRRTVKFCAPILRTRAWEMVSNLWISLYDYTLAFTLISATVYCAIALFTCAIYLVAAIVAVLACICIWQTMYIPIRTCLAIRDERLNREWQLTVQKHNAHKCIPKLPGRTLREAKLLIQRELEAKSLGSGPNVVHMYGLSRNVGAASSTFQYAGHRSAEVGRYKMWQQQKVRKEPLYFFPKRPTTRQDFKSLSLSRFNGHSPTVKTELQDFVEMAKPLTRFSDAISQSRQGTAIEPSFRHPRSFNWSTFQDDPNPAYKDAVRLERTLRTLGAIQDRPSTHGTALYTNPYNGAALVKMQHDFDVIKKFCTQWEPK
ncbi:uncharacterized protein PV09_01886 [Verruconis gallopava]|uniref:Uncharacterized protein n=1 Tax=Verruconis gallopava TaxID=253628 RepID=A0A0D1Z4W4_9PEZI|nr:uncharacterized protein PV09_01886 [Verruconis gallopava]KIW07987.1 hypothetical protein PV09_01886 [Verruconis gallopava]